MARERELNGDFPEGLRLLFKQAGHNRVSDLAVAILIRQGKIVSARAPKPAREGACAPRNWKTAEALSVLVSLRGSR